MREVERKFRIDESERGAVENWCAANGFVRAAEGRQTDVYITPPERNIYLEDRALRVRLEESGGEEKAAITYKGENAAVAPGDALHDRLEIEVGLADGRAVLSIFRQLGFMEILTVRKSRVLFHKGEVSVALDEVDGLGYFLEIEAIAGSDGEQEARGTQGAKEAIDEVACSMGLATLVAEPKNYLELLVEKGRIDE
jgi:adenylate cyclase class 2